MSHPRERHQGSILFITRRTEGRAYRLSGAAMSHAFAVAWAAAAKRTGVKLLCVAVLGNHYHAVA